MHLIIDSHPDIGFAIVKLAQQMANLSNEHYQVGLHLYRYLLSTCKYQIVYDRLSNESIVAHSNSDWVQDPELHKSVTDYFTLMVQGVIFWMSCQQKTVTLSSTEAEYMVLSDCGHQLAWAKSLFNEVSFNVSTPYIYSNILGLLFWGSNPIQKKHSKHIDICYHYIRDLIEDEQVKPYHIDGKENPTDILTKNLGQVLFSHFCPSLGLEIL